MRYHFNTVLFWDSVFQLVQHRKYNLVDLNSTWLEDQDFRQSFLTVFLLEHFFIAIKNSLIVQIQKADVFDSAYIEKIYN